jgi:hypothetical protein
LHVFYTNLIKIVTRNLKQRIISDGWGMEHKKRGFLERWQQNYACREQELTGIISSTVPSIHWRLHRVRNHVIVSSGPN